MSNCSKASQKYSVHTKLLDNMKIGHVSIKINFFKNKVLTQRSFLEIRILTLNQK
jgi:hypothetical protein